MVSPDVILFGWLGSTHQLTHSSKLLVHFQANFIWWYIIISWSVLWKIGWLCSRSKSQQRFEMSTNVSPDDITWTIQPFVTMVICYGGVLWVIVSCRKFGLLPSRSRSQQGLCNLNMSVSAISSRLLTLLQSNLVWRYIRICRSVVWTKLDYCVQDNKKKSAKLLFPQFACFILLHLIVDNL